MRQICLLIFLFTFGVCAGQYPPVFGEAMTAKATVDPMTHIYLTPQRIVWQSGDSLVLNAQQLLQKGIGQASFGKQPTCKMFNKGDSIASIILDFGKEIHGGIQITTLQSNNANPRVRLRFGESVSEACGELAPLGSGYGGGLATNHHAMRDYALTLPGLGTINVGNTGFRFLRIDLLGDSAKLVLKEVRAVAVLRNIPYLGSFTSSDPRLNKIWMTGAYTVQLCMQDYLWDGIKRDRSVWAGDMHPEIATINAVFGYNEVVPKSLDLLRDQSPQFINGIPSYSMWWVLMQYDWYMHQGRLDYLRTQQKYLLSLLDRFTKYVDKSGTERLYHVGMRFLDWPSYGDTVAIHAGLQALLSLTFDRGAKLCQYLNAPDEARKYGQLAVLMRSRMPVIDQSKEAAALLALAGILSPEKADSSIIAVGGPKDFSAYFGYYMLEAEALAGNYTGAMNTIRQFWGGMLDLGATTFWEEFNLDEAKNAAPIDDFVPRDKLDYHRSTGKECYIGLRRSLCHGWASGPTPWLTEHVLGIQVLAPGCKKIRIEPHLGDLKWVAGSFPTPMGLVKVRFEKKADGSIASEIHAPEGVTVIR